jgi:hypothetical protein
MASLRPVEWALVFACSFILLESQRSWLLRGPGKHCARSKSSLTYLASRA